MKATKNKMNKQHLSTMKVIYNCIETGDLKKLKRIDNIEHYFDFEYTDYGWNILHLATWFKQYEILKFLLSMKEGLSKINSIDKNSETPLHLAFFTQGKECIQLLVEHGANLKQENLIHQVPIQTMIASRENQYQILMQIQKTLTNDIQSNSISTYIQQLKQELDLDKGSTAVPYEFQSKNKITDQILSPKQENQILEDDYQFLTSNKNSQKTQTKDQLLLSFQSALNQFNDDGVGLSHFGSQQFLGQNGQSKLESMISNTKRHKRSEIDLEEESVDSNEGEDNIQNHLQKNQNQKIKTKTQLDVSEIQEESKQIDLNQFQTRIRRFSQHSTQNT